MIPEDREALQRLARVNTNLGAVVVAMLDHQNRDGITADALTLLADRLQDAVTDLRVLAASRARRLAPGGPVIEATTETATDDGAGVSKARRQAHGLPDGRVKE